jgi:hypothetical protein
MKELPAKNPLKNYQQIVPDYAKRGLLQNRAGQKDRKRPVALLLGNDKVRQHVAKVLIQHNFDYAATAAKILPATLEQEHVDAIVEKMRKNTRLQAEANMLLQKFGLDEGSFKELIATMWYWLKHPENDRRFAVAAKFMGEAFGLATRKDAQKKPSKLNIAGANEGIRRMMGTESEGSSIIGDEEESLLN